MNPARLERRFVQVFRLDYAPEPVATKHNDPQVKPAVFVLRQRCQDHDDLRSGGESTWTGSSKPPASALGPQLGIDTAREQYLPSITCLRDHSMSPCWFWNILFPQRA